jgi:NAD(P)-dependent dehydrogenase (short-subunit alcohol dehydrogenase family)
MTFQNRHVVVTGGTGALGTAVVGALLEAGATCHVPLHRESERDTFAHRAHARVTFGGPLQLEDAAAVARYYAALPPLWGSIHIAGGFAAGPLAEADDATLRRQIDMNLMTCLFCCRGAVRAMGADGGRIVNIAARPALEWRSGAGMTAYAASKAAIAALTAALAEEVAKQGILVNAVAPSIMDTPANRKAMPKADFAAWPKVEEVARTILFLASPENAVTRGAIVPVYGRS